MKTKTIEQIANEKGGNAEDLYQALSEKVERDDTLFGYMTAWNASEDPLKKQLFLEGMTGYLRRKGSLHDYRTALLFINQMPDISLLHAVKDEMIEARPIAGRLNFCYTVLLSLFDWRKFIYHRQSE